MKTIEYLEHGEVVGTLTVSNTELEVLKLSWR